MDAERIAYSSAKSNEARSAFKRRGFLSDDVGRNMGKMLRNWLVGCGILELQSTGILQKNLKKRV